MAILTSIAYQALNSGALLDTNHKLSDLQFSQMMSFVSDSNMPDPTQSFQHGLFMCKRLRSQGKIGIPSSFWHSPNLMKFSTSGHSDLVIIKGIFQLRQAVRNVAVTVTEELRRANVAVLWAVKIEMGKEQNHRPLPKDILKSLVAQALRLTQSGQSEKSMALNCARLHTADSDMEWIGILVSVLAGLNQTVYLALDLEIFRDGLLIDSHTTRVLSMFTSLINELSSRASSTKVKIIFFTY
jgi:hypothetical protein